MPIFRSSFSIFVTVLASLFRSYFSQVPQEIHPWQTDCLEHGCFIDYFCNHDTNLCERCPKNGIGVSEQDCLNTDASASNNSTRADDCIAECAKGKEGDTCSRESICDEGVYFCNFNTNDDVDSTNSTTVGTCQQCKSDVTDCLLDGTIATDFGREDCLLCDLRVCLPLHFSVIRVEGENETVASNAMEGSPSQSASGPLVGCTNLVHADETTCDDDNIDVAGGVCLVNDFTKNTLYISVVNKCTELGGVAAIFYGDYSPRTPNSEPWTGSLSFEDSSIPSVSISFDDGKRFRESRLGTIAHVTTSDVGNVCIKRQFCSDELPCIGNSAGQYCDYKWSYGKEGFCRECPVDKEGNPSPLSCFFSIDDLGKVTGQGAVESCASVCASELTFPKCKLCPKDITGFEFGVEIGSDRCEFCPEDDLLYPDKPFPLFGEGIACWQVQKFFQTVEVNADASNCHLARMSNYVCGCSSGVGYAGANTKTKQKLLVWLPRIMALLSFMGSSVIIFDASLSKETRKKLQNQLLIGLSIFDIFGSIAYAFTTLPIPEDYVFGPIYGAKGTKASCTAQGFFLQVGTTSAYINVSLSVYYLLVIKYGWSEIKVKRIRWSLFLFPILVGFTLAFAGIPFYGPLALWCNNTASYWPDIPIAVAIGTATVAMGVVCYDVYSKEKASRKYQRSGGSSLSRKVFWQSFFYLMAFYLTWPVYLALQYSWAGGSAFSHYGFIVAAGTMVPLQGYWNMLVYLRPRYFDKACKALRSLTKWRSLIVRSKESLPSSGDPSKRATQDTESGKDSSSSSKC